MQLHINHLQHIGMPITNIHISIAFYERLGFSNVMSSTFMHEGQNGKVAMMRRDSITIELYEMPEPALSAIKQRKDGRIDHIAFDVTDIDTVYTMLQDEGFTMLEAAPVYLNFWQNGCKYFNISGPDGERLEFCEIL